jgi:guanylate kinase
VINVSGPYGVGKDSIVNEIIRALGDRAWRVPTVTTRPLTAGFDPSYSGVTDEEFDELTGTGEWMVTTQLGGSARYGTSIDGIEDAIEDGRIAVHSIYAGPDGAGRIRERFGRRLYSIGLLATGGSEADEIRELTSRLEGRGRDAPATIERRVPQQREKIAYVKENPVIDTDDGPMRAFDLVVVNKDLETATEEVLANLSEAA